MILFKKLFNNVGIAVFIVSTSFVLTNKLNAQKSQDVLMTIGKSTIEVDEFKYIYEKNNGKSADYSKKSVSEYLDLYKKFKLKVEKAKQTRLDTLENLSAELEGYRKQLASSYLMDKEVTEALLKELHNRMSEDIEFSHIFVASPETANKAQKAEAMAKMKDIEEKLKGGMAFGEGAKEYSEDKTTSDKGGHMGYFTAKLPNGFYDLETALYTTPVGKISPIVTSRIGYHIITVKGKRPARGQTEVAHILVDQSKKSFIDSIRKMAIAGKEFELLALDHSIDKNTSKIGGKLPFFGINTYEKSFEDAAFGLDKDGDISMPILSKSGWHLIKRISKAAPDSYDILVRKMKSQINKDDRFETAKIKLIRDIKASANFMENTAVLSKFTPNLTDEFYSYKWNVPENLDKMTLISYNGSLTYDLVDFAEYCRNNTKTRLKYDKAKPLDEAVNELYTEFVNEKTLDFEEKQLVKKYPDYKALLREYEEGILLFEITKINVWDKANQDTIGLKSFYETVKDNYKWEDKAKIASIDIKTDDKKLAAEIYKGLNKKSIQKLMNKYNKNTKVINVTYSEAEESAKEMSGLIKTVGYTTPMEANSTEDSYSFRKIVALIPSHTKTMQEARGYVVADYQDYLEKEWLVNLKKEFKITVDETELNKLIK